MFRFLSLRATKLISLVFLGVLLSGVFLFFGILKANAQAGVGEEDEQKNSWMTFWTVNAMVSNQHGGTYTVDDFDFFYRRDPFFDWMEDLGIISDHEINLGSPFGLYWGRYQLFLHGPAGYENMYDVSFSGDCDSEGYIKNLDFSNDNKVCHIQITDRPANLNVRVNVVNDNGGTRTPADFLLRTDGVNVVLDAGTLPAASVTFNALDLGGGVFGRNIQLDAGSYSVMPLDYAGYAISYSNADCLGTIPVAGTVNCEVNFDDLVQSTEGGFLSVSTTVDNSFGGLATPADFPLWVDGSIHVTAGSLLGLATGNHTLGLSGSGVAGYVVTYGGDCAADGSFNISNGATTTCTVLAQFQLGTLPGSTILVRKHVINDAPLSHNFSAEDFTLFIDLTPPGGSDVDNIIYFPGSETGTPFSFDSTSEVVYSIGEIHVNGYSMTLSENCSGTLHVGEHLECTVTNDDYLETAEGTLEELVISNEVLEKISDFSARLTWTTSHPATSRVVYGNSSIVAPVGENGSNYGYPLTTIEDPTLTTEHSVVISDNIGTGEYFFRPVSHGSPEVFGTELSAQFAASGGAFYFYVPPSDPPVAPPVDVTPTVVPPSTPPTIPVDTPDADTPTAAPQAVLGEKIVDDATTTSTVLGFAILPETGASPINRWLFMTLGISLLGMVVGGMRLAHDNDCTK